MLLTQLWLPTSDVNWESAIANKTSIQWPAAGTDSTRTERALV